MKTYPILVAIATLVLSSCCTDKKVFNQLYGENGKYQFPVDGKVGTSFTLSEFYLLVKETNPKNLVGDKQTLDSNRKIFEESKSKLDQLVLDRGPGRRPPFCPLQSIWDKIAIQNFVFMSKTRKSIEFLNGGIYRNGQLVSKAKFADNAINFSNFVNDTKLKEGEYEIRMELLNKELNKSFNINFSSRFK